MLTLYVRTGCQFCEKVLRAGEELGIEFNLKSVANEGVSEELTVRGGKHQVPYFVDEEQGIEMYESEDIIDYLHQRFAK